ncbi:hypothetical protein Cme02nite_60660 [Catellatospora methionotrophica]|uniref:Uncharacterized protein n=1 Tax=Catellatospora methionotrophica TaxID=121620 RepID=A0A8J3PIG9_9ACTN|nr:hypothetical protein [Catellatospora methionotrophica]GIG17734.1 hypothetical protein Cme02nite_60660 [Catellatospora methionotrophica]
MSDEQLRGRQAPATPAIDDEERLAALDDVDEIEPGPDGFAAAVDEIMGAHQDLLARLAQ